MRAAGHKTETTGEHADARPTGTQLDSGRAVAALKVAELESNAT